MKYTIYNTSTGVIRKALSVNPPLTITDRLREGEAYLEGVYSPGTDKVVDGAPVSTKQDYAPTEEGMRNVRDGMLSSCDWTQGADSPLTDSKKTEWRTYRQALRDLPTNSNWPNLEDGDWPTKPT